MSTPAIASDSAAAATTTTNNNKLTCDQEGCLNDATGYYNIGYSYDNHYYCKPCEPKIRALKGTNSFTYWNGSRDASEREKNVIRCSWNKDCKRPAVDWDYKPAPGTIRGQKRFFHCKECFDQYIEEQKKAEAEAEEKETKRAEKKRKANEAITEPKKIKQ